jgi:predicted dienelactone hydrolase
LASRGYVVASADFPLTSMNAPGGPNAADVVNQPGDVSFLIDSVLALNGADKPFDGEIEPSKIGVMGLSLGGLTATLVGYHRRWRDPRLRAVVSIAGPAAMFTRSFFLTSNAPLLMVAGTQDAIVDYEANAAIIPERAPQATLLTIRDGAHTSFVSLAEPAMRFMNHPDSLGCDALTGNREEAADDDPFAGLGDMNDGINPDQTRLAICNKPLGKALHPGRQQMIAEVGVVSFFQFQFGAEPAQRLAARKLLQEDLPRDLPEASITHGD